MNDLSVVIATRDRAARLARTLRHLAELPERPAVLVVDNGSTDDTVTVARRAGAHVVPLGANLGATARNVGVRQAATPFVAFADDDSWWAPAALGRAAAHLRAHPRLALVAGRILVGPQERLDPVCSFMASAPLGRAVDLPGPSILGFLACGAVVRRAPFLNAGGFDDVVFFMGEEARLAYDLRAAGWGLAYCDDVVAHHHPQRSGPARTRLARRNAVLTSWLRRPLRGAVRQTAGLLADGAEGRQIFGDVLRRLPAALRHRRPPCERVERDLSRLAAAEARPAKSAASVDRAVSD